MKEMIFELGGVAETGTFQFESGKGLGFGV